MTKERMRALLSRAVLGVEAELTNLVAEAVKVWNDGGDDAEKVKFSLGLAIEADGPAIKCKVKAAISTRVTSESETRIEDPDADQTKFPFAGDGHETPPANVVEMEALPASAKPLLLTDRAESAGGQSDPTEGEAA